MKRGIEMGKRNPKNFDFSKLEKFLKTPKSIEEIQEKFKIESYQTAKFIIQMATYCILIYETDGGKGHKKYGIMEKSR